MPSDLLSINLAASLLTTYLIHSTLLISFIWVATRVLRIASPALREQLWKGAALAGLLTTPLQFALSENDTLSAISNRQADEMPVTRVEPQAPEPVVSSSTDDDPTPQATAGPPVGAMDETLATIAGSLSSANDSKSSNAFAVPPLSGDSFAESLHGDKLTTLPYDADLSGDAPSYHNGVVTIGPQTPGPSPAMGEGSDDLEWPASSPMEEFVLGPEQAIENHEPSLPSSNLDPPTSSLHPPSPLFYPPPSLLHFPAVLLRPAAGLMLMLCIACGALRFVVQSLRFHFRVRKCSTIATGPARAALDTLLRKIRIQKTVTLLADTDGSMPAAFGLRNWRILLPADTDEKLTPEELDALLAHELAHLARGDAWWLLFGRLLCSLGMFQPLNFLARREWQRASEWLCDEWALEQQVEPLALARCLTHVAEWNLRPDHFAPAMGAANSPSQLGARIERLIERPTARDPWKRGPRRWLSLAAVLAAVAIATCYAPRASFSASHLTPSPSTARGEGNEEFEPPESVGATAALSASGIDQSASSGATAGLPSSANEPSFLQEQHTLERELQSLDQEILALDSTLREAGANEEMTDFLNRLRARLEALRTRQEVLRDLEIQPPTPHDPQLPTEAK